MGVYIYLGISASVTEKEWADVYNETLGLVDKLPLAELRTVPIHGINVQCLVRSREREVSYGVGNSQTRVGWYASGDYGYMRTAECDFLPKELVKPDIGAGAVDAMLGMISGSFGMNIAKKTKGYIYRLWGNKTQGEPYHLYLLAVACLIEARLGKKAFVTGDITRGQCKRAVRIANHYLSGAPIDVPDRCDMERLYKRVAALPISDDEKLDVFLSTYLGEKDAAFGTYLREHFSECVLDKYWRDIFKDRSIKSIGFGDCFRDYMLWGFSIEKVGNYLNFYSEDGAPLYDEYVRHVMDAKLHLKDKDCYDSIRIDQEDEGTYSVYTQLSQFAFAAARNVKVDRYIPVEDIRRVLRSSIGEHCNVDGIIDDYLAEERKQEPFDITKEGTTDADIEAACRQDASKALKQFFDKQDRKEKEDQNRYDIVESRSLLHYKKGNVIKPGIAEAIGHSRAFLDTLLDLPLYSELMGADAEERCAFIVKNRGYYWLRDMDWEKIFTDIETNPISFSRYFPLVSVELGSEDLVYMATALMVNDDLYAYSKELAEGLENKE